MSLKFYFSAIIRKDHLRAKFLIADCEIFALFVLGTNREKKGDGMIVVRAFLNRHIEEE
jgi:hypothetical protein